MVTQAHGRRDRHADTEAGGKTKRGRNRQGETARDTDRQKKIGRQADRCRQSQSRDEEQKETEAERGGKNRHTNIYNSEGGSICKKIVLTRVYRSIQRESVELSATERYMVIQRAPAVEPSDHCSWHIRRWR